LDEDPLSLDTFVLNGSYVETGDYDDAAPGFDSSIEEHPSPLSVSGFCILSLFIC